MTSPAKGDRRVPCHFIRRRRCATSRDLRRYGDEPHALPARDDPVAGRAGPDPADDGRQPDHPRRACPMSTSSSIAWPRSPRRRPGWRGGSTTRPGRAPVPAGPATRRSTPGTTCGVLAIPAPGDLRQVLDLVGLVDATQFETSRSPWDLTVIEGLDGGRAALYLRADHVLTDGVGGVELMKLLLDALSRRRGPTPPRWRRRLRSPTASATTPPADRRAAAGARADRRAPSGHGDDDGRPDHVGPARDRRHRGGAQPRPRRHGGARRAAGRRDGQLRVPPAGRARRRAVAADPVGLDGHPLRGAVGRRGARRAAIGLGGSRNVLLVAAVAAALGAYHERQGHPVTELRLASPDPRPHRAARAAATRSPRCGSRCRRPSATRRTHFGVVADRLARARREPAMHLTGPADDGHQPAAQPGRCSRPCGPRSPPSTSSPRRCRGSGRSGRSAARRSTAATRSARGPAASSTSRRSATVATSISASPSTRARSRRPDVFLECLEAAFGRLIGSTERPAPGA